ncbi:MAG TPA: FxsA family protein [Solirubrobacterales bacterium]|nr:FxsA family protein [Solirubrobacterales bacterium]
MPLLVILFIVVPIVELYVIIQVGQAIGVVPTLALLVADALLGSLLLRQQGRGAWRRFNAALAEHRFPGREVADGLMIAVGGTLLLTPGFVTDIFGLALLIPPSRAVLRGLLRRVAARRFLVVGAASRMPMGGPPTGGPPTGATRSYDYDGTAEEIDADDPRLPKPEH